MDGERFERVPLRPPGGRPGHVVAVWLTIGLAVVVVAVVGRSLPPKSIAQASLPPMLASPSPVAATSRPAWPPRAAGPPPRTGTAVDLAGLGPAATPSRVLPPGRADIAVGAGAVWVVTTADATARRLDPVTLEVSATVPLPVHRAAGAGARRPVALVVGGHVWVAGLDPRRVFRIEAAGPHAVSAVDAGGEVEALVTGFRAVWLARTDGHVVRIDVRRPGVRVDLEVRSAPVAIAVGQRAVWLSTADGILRRVDPRTGRVVRTYDLGGSALGVSAGNVWTVDGARLARIDEETGDTTLIRGVGASAFSAEGWTLPVSTRSTRIGPRATGRATGLGALWWWDAGSGVLVREPIGA